MHPIIFENLGIGFNINPVAFSIGDKEIYWYGIIITFGIVLSLLLAKRKIKKMDDIQKLSSKITWDLFTDLALVLIPCGVVFARLYYCAFKWDYYSTHIGEIFKIWNGGLAIYGGIIGGLIGGFVFCKVRKVQFLELGDFCIPYVALCQSIGRWGNFVNQEAYGAPTNSFWKMGIFNDTLGHYEYYHPTFLYESVCTFLIFIILSVLSKRKKFIGQIFYLYFILYGIARYYIEGLRMDSLYIEGTNIRVSQALSLVLFAVFTVVYLFRRLNIRAQLIKILRDSKR